ncbi:MAG: TonB-dependent receptor plug domain-containing protein [Ignavibacteria bacterium]|jgi:iron complex outermembrane receptor protein|nr:TonB-dependent receptor plug domain-containing protein [Ignavibacteria bacterium]
MRKILSLCIAMLCFNIAFSQNTPDNIRKYNMDEVLIESNKTMNVGNFEPIATFEQKDIYLAPVNNLQDLLKYLQGMDIRVRGSEGVQADLTLRGGTFDQSIIMLNGVNFTDPQTGHHSLNIPIDISVIERIEILQGIDSWSAGTQAFCGVINIITKNGDAGNAISANATYGAHNYTSGAVVGEMNAKNFTMMLSANGTKTDGFATNTDFDIYNFYLNSSYRSATAGTFALQAGYNAKAFGANSFYSMAYPEQYEETQALIASLKWTKNITNLNVGATAYYRKHNDKFELFRWEKADWYEGHNYHKTNIYGINAFGAYNWNIGITTLGTDFRSEDILSSNLGEPLDNPKAVPGEDGAYYLMSKLRQHTDAYLQHYYSDKVWSLQVGLMAKGNNDFGFRAISGGNFRYTLDDNMHLSLALQQCERLPTFTDLYYTSATQRGNIDLEPEEALHSEILYSWNKINISNNTHLNLKSDVFYRWGYKTIDWVRIPAVEEQWHSENFTDVQTMGFDILLDYQLRNCYLMAVKLCYSYLDVNKKSNDNYLSQYATDFLRHQLMLGIQHKLYNFSNAPEQTNNISANWQFRFQDRAGEYANAANVIKDYAPYLLCDLKVIWQMNCYNVYLEATNLFDNRAYVDPSNLIQPGIWVKAGVAVNIGL